MAGDPGVGSRTNAGYPLPASCWTMDDAAFRSCSADSWTIHVPGCPAGPADAAPRAAASCFGGVAGAWTGGGAAVAALALDGVSGFAGAAAGGGARGPGAAAGG